MRNTLERKQVSQTVVQFLEREDNSACMPGKRDATKSEKDKTQTRILSDYLYNLHLKFKAEYPGIQISLTTFSSYRPTKLHKTRPFQFPENMSLPKNTKIWH